MKQIKVVRKKKTTFDIFGMQAMKEKKTTENISKKKMKNSTEMLIDTKE